MCKKWSAIYFYNVLIIFATILGVSNADTDKDTDTLISQSKLPLTLDYTMYLEPGQSDWYYQEAEPGAVLFIDIEVIKKGSLMSFSVGMDGAVVGLGIKDPNNVDLVPYNWRTNATYVTESAIGGYYSFQIDNKYSLFSAARVAVYISSYRDDDMDIGGTSLAEEIEETTKNISKKMTKIEKSVKAMKSFLWLSRKLEKMDFAILNGNQTMVTNWSIIQCIVIILSGALHVFFIRRFFKTPSTSTSTRRLLNSNQNGASNFYYPSFN